MNDFVEECRREWRRLRVPDPVANEMAADLQADLDEAQADGASAEAVLGTAAFDARSFAAAWAAERGFVEPPLSRAPVAASRRRSPLLVGIAVSVLVAVVGFALASVRTGVSVAQGRPFRFATPPYPPAAPLVLHPASTTIPEIGVILVLVGIVGVLLALVYWSPWVVRIQARHRDR
jgi:hypothetical protein